MKKFLRLITIVIVAQTATAQTVWNGTADIGWYNEYADEFSITTAEQLAGLAVLVNDGNNFSTKTIKLERNIILNDTANWKNFKNNAPDNEWIPIGGGYQKDFRGTFDGNGYVISGVYINSTNQDVGFFGSVCDANIINVGIAASYVKGGDWTGGLAGLQTGRSMINGCFYTGEVAGFYSVGGLVGQKDGSSVINNSYSAASVSGTHYVGGLAGNNTRSTIINSYSIGAVFGDSYVGGLTGENSESRSAVSFCYSTASVSGNYKAGGLIGSSEYDAKTNYSFYDKETSGQNDDENKGKGKTTQEMKQKTTFDTAYWDFETVWGIDPKINGGYPYLLGNLPNYEENNSVPILKKPIDSRYGILLESAVLSQTAKIKVITPKSARINIAIYDNLGNIVFEKSGVRGNTDILWNLTNKAGRYVANGSYMATAEAKNENGKIDVYYRIIGVKR